MSKYNNNIDNIDDNKLNKIFYEKEILIGKIHESLEDPISQAFYEISDTISPYLCKIGIKPNQITALRFLSMTSLFIYCFKNKLYKIASVIFLIAYFCDCLDGHMSRRYNLDTKFGDYFDHIADVFTMLITFYFIFTYIDKKYTVILVVILVLLVLSMIQMGCQERYLDIMKINRDSDSISLIKCLCPKNIISNKKIENVMEFTRLFGVGTFIVVITIIIWNFDKLEKKI